MSQSEMFDVVLILGWAKGLFLGHLCTILNILVFTYSFVCVNLSYKYFAYILNLRPANVHISKTL